MWFSSVLNCVLFWTLCFGPSVGFDCPSTDHEVPPRREECEIDLGLKIVCYYVNWAQYRPWIGAYTVDNIDPCLCTHIIFAFANIVGTDMEPIEPNDIEMYSKMRNLKQINWDLKVMVSVGGAEMEEPFQNIASSQAKRKAFAQSAVEYLNAHKFDGLDIDWEFPKAIEKQNFTELLRELKTAFDANTKRELELSCALGAQQTIIYTSYDIPAISSTVDFVNLMTYDLHGGWDPLTGFHSALFGFHEDDIFHQQWVVKQYLDRGLDRKKAILGIPTFGRSFTLCNRTSTDPRSAACGYGEPGPQTYINGTMSYYEICRKQGLVTVYDETQEVPYGHVDDLWVGFDNVRSIQKKKEFIHNESLGGVMIWDLSTDDFCNYCDGGIYPLLKVFDPSAASTSSRGHCAVVTSVLVAWLLKIF